MEYCFGYLQFQFEFDGSSKLLKKVPYPPYEKLTPILKRKAPSQPNNKKEGFPPVDWQDWLLRAFPSANFTHLKERGLEAFSSRSFPTNGNLN
ncbi:hypothetical protein VNO78_35238 [Psophocarpus tetragonolobus]|uniref:Uncharacterized protein n=1 Tax=Psophocarpus tetragonolobus TaxID=3891 RepID=A0AAN9NU86_PSOTE